MRNKIILLLFLTSIILSSCASSTFYQVYKAVPDESIIERDNFLIYEDENCEVIYNLWQENGNIGFLFHNKTDETIFLNLEESFFIHNNIAYDYYKDRIFTISEGSGLSLSGSSAYSTSMAGYNILNLIQTNSNSTENYIGSVKSSEQSVSFAEKKIVRIPSKSSKVFTEYTISETLIRDCDLLRYPKNEKQVTTLKFEKSYSPIVFGNRLMYYTENLQRTTIENEFYVSEITNYPRNLLVSSVYEEYCGQKSAVTSPQMKYFSPAHFYSTYIKETEVWKH